MTHLDASLLIGWNCPGKACQLVLPMDMEAIYQFRILRIGKAGNSTWKPSTWIGGNFQPRKNFTF